MLVLSEALVLADSLALVDALCEAEVLADSDALVDALCDADVLADSLALVDSSLKDSEQSKIRSRCTEPMFS